MLQIRLEDEAGSPDKLDRYGAVFTNPDPELTESLLERFLERKDAADLIQIADHWYGKGRGKLQPTFEMMDNTGQRLLLRLPTALPTSSW